MKSTIAGTCRSIGLLLLVAAAAACGVEDQAAPTLIGPSGFAQSVTLSASPDRLSRDGSSQSVVTITVRNESGQPVSGQRVSVGASGGTLSATEVTTGSDGRAAVVVTAPPAGSIGNAIDVFATPVGGNFNDAVTRGLSIALIGATNTTAPVPLFTTTPTSPAVQQLVTFDASTTTDEGAPCGSACTFTWTFSDGTTRQGSVVTRTFTSAGSHTVTLTVTDAAGTTASVTQAVVVASVASPTVTLSVSPSPPQLGQTATFAATAVPATGHNILSYRWSFGDGSAEVTTTSPTVNKTYTSPGTFVATVTATDDVGQTGSASTSVSVSSVAAPTVTMAFAPNPPVAARPAAFTASATAATGHSIRLYTWDFGDGTALVTTTTAGTSHVYARQGLYVAKVTVTDDVNQTASVSSTFTIVESAVHATITWSPSEPVAGQRILFHALNPTAPNGAAIASYDWNFGDPRSGGDGGTGSGQTTDYTYSTAGTFVVRLTLTDTNGFVAVYTTQIEIE